MATNTVLVSIVVFFVNEMLQKMMWQLEDGLKG